MQSVHNCPLAAILPLELPPERDGGREELGEGGGRDSLVRTKLHNRWSRASHAGSSITKPKSSKVIATPRTCQLTSSPSSPIHQRPSRR
jgi:hypothetical protein